MRILISIVLLLNVLIGFPQTPFNQTYGTSSWEGSVFIMNEPDSTFSMSFIEEYNTALYRSFLLNIDHLGAILSGAHTNNYVNTIWNSHTIANNSKLNVGLYDATGNTDVLIQKVDSHNNEVWIKNYGGSSSDFAFDSHLLSDSGLLIVGSTNSFGAGGYDVYIIRADKNGDSLWTRTFGGTGFEEATAIVGLSDSTFLICGTTSSFGAQWTDIFIMEINLDGDTSSLQLFGEIGNDHARAMVKTSDGAFAICGWQLHNTSVDGEFKLMKIDSNGNVIFNRSYGYLGMDEAWSIKETFDHGFILVGYSEQMSASEDVYIVCTDSIGDTLWTRTIGGALDDRAYSVVQSPDSGFAIVGLTYSFGAGGADAFFLKLNKLGNITTSIGLIQPYDSRLYVYPNPASDIVNIMIPDFFQSEKVSCEIIDASGRLLNRVEARDSQSIISIHIVDLEDGVYIIRVYSPHGFSIQKLIVRKSY